jgi:uncharacterized phage protein (TIGR02218 family)
MTYDAHEKSVQSAAPKELYTFTAPTFTYRFTSHDQDLNVNGVTFTSLAISRGNVAKSPMGQTREMIVSMPRNHELVSRLRNNGITPRGVEVKIERYHHAIGGIITTREVWRGDVASIESEDAVTRIRVPSQLDDRLNVHLPVVRAQRTCNHMLYDRGCQVARASFKVNTTILTVNGTTLTVASMGGQADGWSKYGDIIRAEDGESRSVLSHVGTTLIIDVPFGTMNAGDVVDVSAGCDRLLDTCFVKFNNIPNFGGHPEMPQYNPSAPTGYGVIVQA